jgi:AbrB family looped-hinge helix DNA binding protein
MSEHASGGVEVRITARGQVTIPVEIRQKLGLFPGSEVEFVVEGEGVRIDRRPDRSPQGRGAGIVRRLRGTGTVPRTTDEILALTRKL